MAPTDRRTGAAPAARAGDARAFGRRALAALLWLALWALATLPAAAPAQAQTLGSERLVWNTHHPNSTERGFSRQAQSFTTGDGSYWLESVELGIWGALDRSSGSLVSGSFPVTVYLYRDNGGAPGTYVAGGSSSVTTQGRHTYVRIRVDALLNPRTTYWLAINTTRDAGRIPRPVLISNAPAGDERGLAGWSIGNGRTVWCEADEVVDPDGENPHEPGTSAHRRYNTVLENSRGYFCPSMGRSVRNTPLEMRLRGRRADATQLSALAVRAAGRRLDLRPGFHRDRLSYEADSGLSGQVMVEAWPVAGSSTVSIAGDDDPSTPREAAIDLARWPRTNPTQIRVTVTDDGGNSRTYRVTVRNGKLDYTHINRSRFWDRDYAAGYLSTFWDRAHVPRVSQPFRTGSDAAAYRFEGVDIKLDTTSGMKAHLYSDRGGRPYRSLAELKPVGGLANRTMTFRAEQRGGQYPLLEPDTPYHVMFTLDGDGGRVSLDLANPGENDTGLSEAGFRLHDGSLSYILGSSFNEMLNAEVLPDEDVARRPGDFGYINCNSPDGNLLLYVPRWRFRNVDAVRAWIGGLHSDNISRNFANYDMRVPDLGWDTRTERHAGNEVVVRYARTVVIYLGNNTMSCIASQGEYGDSWLDSHPQWIRDEFCVPPQPPSWSPTTRTM